MQLEVEQVDHPAPITILALIGELDAASYQSVIDKVKMLYDGGTRNLLLDMSQMPFMASSGLVALHSIALIMRGEDVADSSTRWQALHSVSAEFKSRTSYEPHCKLLAPEPRIAKTLKMTGFDNLFEQFAERDAALAAFATASTP